MHDQLAGTVVAKRIEYENREPVIVASFTDEKLKRQFVKQAKKKRISTEMYGYVGESKPIYVDEQLTRQTFMLFKHAKSLKKLGCTYVWISNGDIMARINSTSPFIKITQKHQVDELEKVLILKKSSDNKSTVNSNEETPTDTRRPRSKSEKNEKKQQEKIHNKPTATTSSAS